MDDPSSRQRNRIIFTVIGLLLVAAGLYAATLMRFGEMMAGGK